MAGDSEDAASQHLDADETRFGTITASSDDQLAEASIRDTHTVYLDEPARDWMPYGDDAAPSPGDYLGTAIAGCQLEVLRQCLEKARIDEYELEVNWQRRSADSNEDVSPMPDHTSTRVREIELDLTLKTTEKFEDRARRCLEVCEDGCIMSRSVEAGIETPIDKEIIVDSE